MENLFSYRSYRKFLKDSFESEKASVHGVTLSGFARKLSLAASTFKMILTGERNLTIANIHRIARAFGLNSDEWEFFEALVLFEQAKDPLSRGFYKQKLRRSSEKSGNSAASKVRVSNSCFVVDPIAPVLLVYLLDIEKIRRSESIDVGRIARKFHVSADRVQHLISILCAKDSLMKNTENPIHVKFERITQQLSEKSYVIRETQEMIKHLESSYTDPSTLYRAFTLSMTEADVPALRADLISVMEKYMKAIPDAGEPWVIEKVVVGVYPALHGKEA